MDVWWPLFYFLSDSCVFGGWPPLSLLPRLWELRRRSSVALVGFVPGQGQTDKTFQALKRVRASSAASCWRRTDTICLLTPRTICIRTADASPPNCPQHICRLKEVITSRRGGDREPGGPRMRRDGGFSYSQLPGDHVKRSQNVISFSAHYD